MKKAIKFLIIYFNIIILKKEKFKNYFLRNWSVTDYVFRLGSGIEIINETTLKVVYRKGKDCQNMDCRFPKHQKINQIFLKNIK